MTPERLGFLLDRHAAALELFARQWCASPEDVVQEAFLKLSQQNPEPLQLTAWLYRVVRNAAISMGRSEKRRQYHEVVGARTSWFVEDDSRRLDAAAVTDALAALTPDSREIIVAHLWGGLTFEEIAEVAGTSTATAYRRYTAGIEELRNRITQCPTNRTL